MLSSGVLSHWWRRSRTPFRVLQHRRYIDLTSTSIGCHPERTVFIRLVSFRTSPEAIVHEIIELVLLLAFLLEIDLYLFLVRALTIAHVEDAVAALSVLDRWLFWADYIRVLNRENLAREEGVSSLLGRLRILPGQIRSIRLTLVHSLVNVSIINCLVNFTKDRLKLRRAIEWVLWLIKVWDDSFVTLFHHRSFVQSNSLTLSWQVQTLLTEECLLVNGVQCCKIVAARSHIRIHIDKVWVPCWLNADLIGHVSWGCQETLLGIGEDISLYMLGVRGFMLSLSDGKRSVLCSLYIFINASFLHHLLCEPLAFENILLALLKADRGCIIRGLLRRDHGLLKVRIWYYHPLCDSWLLSFLSNLVNLRVAYRHGDVPWLALSFVLHGVLWASVVQCLACSPSLIPRRSRIGL